MRKNLNQASACCMRLCHRMELALIKVGNLDKKHSLGHGSLVGCGRTCFADAALGGWPLTN
jgi:hypothetical protein